VGSNRTRRPGVELDPKDWKRVFGIIVLKTKAGSWSNSLSSDQNPGEAQWPVLRPEGILQN